MNAVFRSLKMQLILRNITQCFHIFTYFRRNKPSIGQFNSMKINADCSRILNSGTSSVAVPSSMDPPRYTFEQNLIHFNCTFSIQLTVSAETVRLYFPQFLLWNSKITVTNPSKIHRNDRHEINLKIKIEWKFLEVITSILKS